MDDTISGDNVPHTEAEILDFPFKIESLPPLDLPFLCNDISLNKQQMKQR